MRAIVVVAAVTAGLLAHAVSVAAAPVERSTASRAVPGQILSAPRARALVTHAPVRAVVRVPVGTKRLRVRVGARDVTARFRAAGGARRVARLTLGDGLRYGNNHLVVVAERGGGRPVIDARSFVLARRDAHLVRVRVRKGPVTWLGVQVAAGAGLGPGHFRSRKEVARRLSVMQRERTVRVWLNGRRVTRTLDRSHLTRWTARLSAAHGLRHGVNRLRIRITEPDRGRYALIRRTFVVPRHLPLAAAGWDRAARVGGRVRLDGRASRTAGGERPESTWRIVSKPRGSRAALRRAGVVRPFLTPDRPGRYVIANVVKAPATRGQAAQTGADQVTVTVAPQSLLVPFKGITVNDKKPGIQIGGTFYPNPSPNGSALQWLTLNRSTLDPTTAKNGWLDGSGSGDHGLNTFTAALSAGGLDQLMILSFPFAGGPGPPVQKDQEKAFNSALASLGVAPIPSEILQDRNKLVIAGVPSGGPGSGRYIHGGGAVDGLTGWLMPDATLAPSGAVRYRLQPERPQFDTASKSTATTNTMTLRGQPVDDALPAGAAGGFQVALVNPTDFTVADHKVFATNGVADPAGGLRAMAAYLNGNASSTTSIAVQSIGQVTNPQPPENPNSPNPGDDAWRAMVSGLAAYGANPHTLYSASGSYAFVGGTKLDRTEVEQSSSAVVIDPVANKRQSGTLSGRAGMRADGYFTPAVIDASRSFEFSLYDIAFRAPTPWPYTAGAQGVSKDAAVQYAAALAYITSHLPLLHGWAPDVRQSYVGNDDITYGDSRQDLIGMPYPGTSVTCGSAAPDPPKGRGGADPGFTQAQFCAVNNELRLEFEWLDATKALFAAWTDALNTSGNKEQVDLHKIGEDIINQIDRPIGGSAVGWSLGGFVGNMTSAGLVLNPAVEPLAAWEALVVVYELIRELVSEPGGLPVGERIETKVNDLSAEVAERLSDSARGLDGLRDVVTSDYGRLQALGNVAFGPAWKIDRQITSDTLTTAANGFFRTELMPIAYDTVWYLAPNGHGDDTADGCGGPFFTHPWRGTPATGQMQWSAGFKSEWGARRNGRWLLGKTGAGTGYAPKELTDPMFKPLAQNGAGVSLPDFFWTAFKNPPTRSYQCR